jgi:hypothetical protein
LYSQTPHLPSSLLVSWQAMAGVAGCLANAGLLLGLPA